MWKRTLIGFFFGLVFSLSLGINAILFLPTTRPTGLLVAFVGGFLVFTAFQTWVFCTRRFRPLILGFVPITLGSVALNAWALLTRTLAAAA